MSQKYWSLFNHLHIFIIKPSKTKYNECPTMLLSANIEWNDHKNMKEKSQTDMLMYRMYHLKLQKNYKERKS